MSGVFSEVDPDIRLGFVEPVIEEDQFLLHATQFPSKVGGKPVWLNPNVPQSDALKCKLCDDPLSFIMQIYAPIDGADHCYHRSLYLFGCTSCNANFRCYRTQLPLENNVYSPNSPPNSPRTAVTTATAFDKVISVDGPVVQAPIPELMLEVEEEPTSDNESDVGFGDESGSEDDESDFGSDDMDEKEKARVADLLKRYEESGGVEMDESEREAWDKLADETTHQDNKDRIFRTFRKRCTRAPGQVMRYQRNGEPLWFAAQGKPANPPPACARCGCARTFEFQVQPQMYEEVEGFEELGLEFAVLVVSTCMNSCEFKEGETNGELGGYVEEHVYRQKEQAETPV